MSMLKKERQNCMEKLRIHGFVEKSNVNGPGVRFVVWAQGCPHKCPGCCNPGTWDFNGGTEYTVDQILAMIPFDMIDGITFSGGEPFSQAAGFSKLAEMVRFSGKNVLVYTGYLLEQLQSNIVSDALRLLEFTDILIDGPYRREIPPVHPWAGSGNQRIFKMKHGSAAEEIFASSGPLPVDMEIHILADGTVVTTGFR